MVTIDTYVKPEDLINAILAVGQFDAEKIQEKLGSRLATLAAVKVLAKRLDEITKDLIPEANVEFINLQKQTGQKAPRAFGAVFKENKGRTSYVYSNKIQAVEKDLKEMKEEEKKSGAAVKQITPPSNGSNFSISV